MKIEGDQARKPSERPRKGDDDGDNWGAPKAWM